MEGGVSKVEEDGVMEEEVDENGDTIALITFHQF